MRELKNIITITYEYERDTDFRIDIVIDGTSTEAYLYHKDCGIKSLMFGIDDISKDDFIDLVELNLCTETYIEDYIADYMED
jgi:hypothetical protein